MTDEEIKKAFNYWWRALKKQPRPQYIEVPIDVWVEMQNMVKLVEKDQ